MVVAVVAALPLFDRLGVVAVSIYETVAEDASPRLLVGSAVKALLLPKHPSHIRDRGDPSSRHRHPRTYCFKGAPARRFSCPPGLPGAYPK